MACARCLPVRRWSRTAAIDTLGSLITCRNWETPSRRGECPCSKVQSVQESEMRWAWSTSLTAQLPRPWSSEAFVKAWQTVDWVANLFVLVDVLFNMPDRTGDLEFRGF